MALKLIDDNEKSFKIQRDDGKIIHVAKTPQTEPIYKLCKGGASAMSEGGKVPGKAEVKGDSPKNDTISAKLSPGEMVIPREVVAKGPEAIAAWVKDALAGKHPAKKEGDGKVHAFDGAGPDNVYQQTANEEIPQAPTPQQFQGTPSVASEPAPPLATTDTGMTSPTGSATAPQPGMMLAQNTPPPSVKQGPMVAEANVPGNGATPEQPQGPTTNTGFDPYKPVVSQSTTDSSTTHAKGEAALDDFVNKSIQDNYKAQLDAGTQLQKNIAERATAEANKMGEFNQQMAAVNVDRNKEINSRLDQLKQVTNKFLGMSIDSNHLYGDSGTGSRIMAGIGLMMGAVGQGLSGKESPVPGIIERNIDRDINIQKANIEKAGKDVEMLSGGLKEYMGATNDMQTAMAAEKSRMLEQVGKQFEATAAANSSPIVKAQAMQNAMMFKEKATQLAMDVQSNVHSDVTQSMMPHFESQNAEQVNKMHANIEVQAKTEHMVDMLNSGLFASGPWNGRKAKLAARFGLESGSEADFLQNFSQVKDQIVHDIASARGLQPEAMKNFTALAGDITANKDALVSYLGNLNTQAKGENDMIARTNRENHRWVMDLQGERDAYDKANPKFVASKIGFNPQTGTKKRR